LLCSTSRLQVDKLGNGDLFRKSEQINFV